MEDRIDRRTPRKACRPWSRTRGCARCRSIIMPLQFHRNVPVFPGCYDTRKAARETYSKL